VLRVANDEPGNLQSVRRALRALELIAERGEMGVTELGRELEVHKATASRLFAALAEHGFLERDPVTDKYRIGYGLVSLAGAAIGNMDVVRTARPMLESLAEKTRETVNLGVLSGDDVVHVDQVAGARSIVSVNWVGQRTPLHATSNGKVLLAWLPDSERERLLSHHLARSTPRTLTDRAALRAALEEVRVKGYAQTIEELEEGLNAVAAPIHAAEGDVIAALSVSGPAFRLRPVDMPRMARFTIESANAISRRLGYKDRVRTASG
jgi:DNA-binding IclR family transcriptional regulator